MHPRFHGKRQRKGRIFRVVDLWYRDDMKLSDEEILEKIKVRFNLDDYHARTFVYSKEAASF